MSRWVGYIRGLNSISNNRKSVFIIISILFLLFPASTNLIIKSNAADPISNENEYVIGAYTEFGQGRCFFYTDSTSFTNPCFGNEKGKFDVEDMNGARQLALNTVSWLGQGGKELLLDQRHNELDFYSNNNRIVTFQNYLEDAGYKIDPHGRWSAELSYELLIKYDTLLLIGSRDTETPNQTVKQYSFSNNEISNITRYVEEGGGLFVLCVGEDSTHYSNDEVEITDRLYNPLLEVFGVELMDNIPDIDMSHYNTWNFVISMEDHPLTQNISDLPQDYYTHWLSISSPSKPVIYLTQNPDPDWDKPVGFKSTKNGIIAGYSKYGAGRTVFCGSEEPFLLTDYREIRNYPDQNLQNAENFSINIINWLGQGGKRVLIDQLHNQPEPNRDYRELGAFELLLKKNGFLVTTNFESIFDPELSLDILLTFDILILIGSENTNSYAGALYRWSYSEQEIDNITKFVELGGGLLVMTHSQRNDLGASNDIINQIGIKFGIQFNNDTLYHQKNYYWQIASHPLTENVSVLPLRSSSTLNFSGNATELIYVEAIVEEPKKPDLSGLGWIILLLIILIITIFTVIRTITTELGKYKLFCLISPMYTKLRKDKILNNKTRGMIREYILDNPGTHYNSLKRMLNLSNGALAYHLKTLENEGFVTSKKHGMYKILYPVEIRDMSSDPYMSTSKKKIYGIVQSQPGLTQKQVSERVELSLSTVNYHIHSMLKAGLVRLKRDGNKTRCFVENKIPSEINNE
jgi:predicted transcriptional regulator/uncharacterized membrane protein